MSFEFFISSRYLRSKQRHVFISLITLLSVAGVTVGVMALIVVIAVMAGFESDLKNRILGIESHLLIMRHGGAISDYHTVRKKIESVEGVEATTPFVYTQVMLRSAYGLSGAVLRGIEPETAGKVINVLDEATIKKIQPSFTEASGDHYVSPGILLGEELAAKLGVKAGNTIYLISPKGLVSPMGHLPSMKRFTVSGTFKSGMYEYDGSLAYIHIQDAQKILRLSDSVTGIEARVNDIYKANQIATMISAKLGFPYWTRDWMQMNHNLFSALKLEKTVMFIILALIILVAAFNIASSLIMMVMEKTRDIAILKAMGATNRNIKRIFVFKGMVIGFVGTVLGVCLGFILCTLLKQYKFIELPPDVYYITTLPVRMNVPDVIVIAGAAMVICFVSTLYPAHQASRLDPVEAIRYG